MSTMDRVANTAEIDNAMVIKKVLESARKSFYFAQFGQEDSFRQREGQTVMWFTRSALTAATDTFASDNPTLRGNTVTHTAVTANLAMYGNDVTFIEGLAITSLVDIPGGVLEEISYNAGLSIDTVVRDLLLAGTTANTTSGITQVFAGGHSSATIASASTDYAAYNDIIDIATLLEENDVPRFVHPGTGLGVYVAIITPRQKKWLMRDTNFQKFMQYNDYKKAWYGELGIIDNVAFVVSSNSTTYTYNTSVTCEKALITGRGAYGISATPSPTGVGGNANMGTVGFADNTQWTMDMVNKMFKIVVTKPGDGNGGGAHGDEYAVKTTIAWKAYFAYSMLQKGFARVYVSYKG